MQKGKNGFPAVVKLSEMSMHVCSKKHQQPAPTVALGLGVVPINMFFSFFTETSETETSV